MTNYQKVREFNTAIGHGQDLKRVRREDILFRFGMILGQVAEGLKLAAAGDEVGVRDALINILYSTYATCARQGWDADAAFAEVHRRNLAKLKGC